jgi:chitin disaccharide deacetylase
MYVIVNADDLGISAKVNDAIFELMAARLISSATILANGPAMRDAVARLHLFPGCSFGVHLNLTQFHPLTGAAATVLTSGTGELSRSIEHASPSVMLLRAAFDECCAQIDRLAGAGVHISHFDSHNHVHTRPHIFPVLKALQRRYRIRRVRLAKNLYGFGQSFPASLRWKKWAYNAALRRVYRTWTTDVFTEFVTFVELCRESAPAFQTAEVMVHPGAAYATEETKVLRSDWLKRVTGPPELINYTQLG